MLNFIRAAILLVADAAPAQAALVQSAAGAPSAAAVKAARSDRAAVRLPVEN